MLHLDFETRSLVELRGQKSVGLWNYANHLSTSVLMLGWAVDNEPAQVWEPRNGPMPAELEDRLRDPSVELAAFNSTFERYISKFKLGIDTAIERYQDPQASARYLSLPGDLEDVSTILGLPEDLAKDKEGKRLIDLFSKPHKKRKKKGEEAEEYFPDWTTHPEEWAKFVEYCRRDVVAEREVMRRLKLLEVFPLPPLERKIWVFDQKVNDRGIPVDINFVRRALKLAEREKKEKIDLNNQKTGLANSNSGTKLLAWAKTQGYKGVKVEGTETKDSLEKEVVDEQLKNNKELTPLCREVLEIRKSASSTSYQKMAAILRQVSPDNRLRNQFIYMGSARAGRWSGNAVQLHNMARPNSVFEEEENVDRARALIYAEDYDAIKREFDSVLLTVKYNIRTAFVAEKGNRFNVADLNAIETRSGAWLVGCESLLNGFRNIPDFDPYLDFGSKMSGIPYAQLIADKKSKDSAVKAAVKKLRQTAKPGVLACIYRMGAPRLQSYAEDMGIPLTLEQCEEIVRIFREAYSEFTRIWTQIEESIMDVMKGTKTVRYLGPNDCIKIDKFVFTCNNHPRTILRIHLPSGRRLHYLDARLQNTLMPWKDKAGNDVYREAVWYAAQDQKTKQWSETTSHGGKFFENMDQGFSRDVLAVKLLMFEDNGLPVVAHVHDEGIAETPDDIFSPGVREMNAILAQPIDSWAKGLPLGSDGFEGLYYRKA